MYEKLRSDKEAPVDSLARLIHGLELMGYSAAGIASKDDKSSEYGELLPIGARVSIIPNLREQMVQKGYHEYALRKNFDGEQKDK